MRWSALLTRIDFRGRRGPVDAPTAAVARWRHAQSLFNETVGTIPAHEPQAGAAIRAVDSAIAELWAAERHMALHFDGADRSTPVVWPWMRQGEPTPPQGADRVAS
jgi:hypothetical protein